MNNQFIDWLQSRQFSKPLTEAVQTLYEGLTKSDMALGKYLKSFNNGVNVPPPTHTLPNDEKMSYMTLARYHDILAQILDIGANYGIPQDGEEEFDDLDAEFSIQMLIQEVCDPKKNRNNGPARCAAAELSYIFTELHDKSELRHVADLYRTGRSDQGYDALKNALGYHFEYFVNSLTRLWAAGDTGSDRNTFVMNPDVKYSVVRNKWLVHDTGIDNGFSIIKNGFDRGNVAGDLALTTCGSRSYCGDYLFAHDAEDMIQHSQQELTRGFGSYGDFTLVFRGSGYKAYHTLDEEYQVMFDYHEPKAFYFIMHRDDAERSGIPVKNTEFEDFRYAVYGKGKTGSPMIIYADNNAYKCLEWILQHGDTYRNVMFTV